MKNLILLLALALPLSFQACTTSPKYKDLPPIETVKSDQIKQSPTPAPSATPKLATNEIPSNLKGYISLIVDEDESQYYKDIFMKAEIGMNAVLQSEAFKNEMLKTKIDLQQNYPTDAVKKLKTNLDAYNYIASQKIKVQIAFYSKRFTSAVAYRSGDTILFNTRKVGSWSVKDFASTSLHESTHCMGFDHFFDPSTQRDISLPYIMNVILEKLWKE